jgi:hypothetical protein
MESSGQCICHQNKPQHTSERPIASCVVNLSRSRSSKVWSESSDTRPLFYLQHAGFFTPINAAMKGSPKKIVLGANSEVRASLEDLCTLLRILASRPTHVKELVPDMPHYVGYHDAAAEGAGGVWFSLVDNMSPTVWRTTFPWDIAAEVVSDDNPEGRLTNSDLELAAEVMAVGIALAVAPKVKHVPLGTLCDNTPTVSWIEKMASKAKGPTAGRLLQGLAVMLHGNKVG